MIPGTPGGSMHGIGGHKEHSSQIRIVVTGKGGVGKTTLTALLAHQFSRNGLQVLAVDCDPQQNLAVTLGIAMEEAAQIVPVSKSADYLCEKTGAGKDLSPGGLLTLNPDVSDVVDRFAVPVAEKLRLLVMGGVRQAGSGCLCPEYTLLAAVLRRIHSTPDAVVLLDTPAGLEHFGRAIADGFSTAMVVTDLSYNALAVAGVSAILSRELGIRDRILLVNKAGGSPDRARLQGIFGLQPDLFSRVEWLSADPEIALNEPSVIPLFQKESGIARQAGTLAQTLLNHPDSHP